jgi:hypothetical protein
MEQKSQPPETRRGPPILAGAFGGKGGSAPGRCVDAKLRARKLALTSEKPMLVVKHPLSHPLSRKRARSSLMMAAFIKSRARRLPAFCHR